MSLNYGHRLKAVQNGKLSSIIHMHIVPLDCSCKCLFDTNYTVWQGENRAQVKLDLKTAGENYPRARKNKQLLVSR
jgi:hypothetical protein